MPSTVSNVTKIVQLRVISVRVCVFNVITVVCTGVYSNVLKPCMASLCVCIMFQHIT